MPHPAAAPRPVPAARRRRLLRVLTAGAALTALGACESMERGISFRPYTDSDGWLNNSRPQTERTYAPGSLSESRDYIYSQREFQER